MNIIKHNMRKFEKKFVFEHIMREKQFYPKGFMKYISYCVKTVRNDS